MTYQEAVDEARRINGVVDWSSEKGWFVTGGYPEARPAHWWEEYMAAPWWKLWQGMTPWQDYVRTPEGEVILAKPQMSVAAQQEMARVGEPPPEGFELVQPTYEEREAEYDEGAYLAYKASGGTLTKEEWVAADRPPMPTGEELRPDEFVRLDPMNGYLVPVYRDSDGNEYMAWNEAVPSRDTAEPPQWEQEQLQQQQEFEAAQQAEMIGWYREQQAAQLEAERQRRLAQLAAQPISWLQYATEAGTQPVVQPWMLPLMPEQYGQLGAGQPIPGYQGTEGMTGMPSLLRPSRQYQARMGPTAQQQYYGYQQARTGATPSETQFRQWSSAPPSGQFPGLYYRR